MFDLTLRDTPEYEDDVPFYLGTIRIDTFAEDFFAAASLWTPQHYRRQWQGAARLLLREESKAAFITSFAHPDGINVVWPAWREGELVYLHNQLSLPESRGHRLLDPRAPERFVGPRVTVGPDGPVSEWAVSIGAIAAFANGDLAT